MADLLVIGMRHWSPLGAHARWIAALREFIYGVGEMDAHNVAQDTNCELGHWIYGEGKSFHMHDEYRRAKETHKTFHRRAARVVSMVNSGRRLEAAADLAPDGELRRLSVELANAFNALNRKILSVESEGPRVAEDHKRSQRRIKIGVNAN